VRSVYEFMLYIKISHPIKSAQKFSVRAIDAYQQSVFCLNILWPQFIWLLLSSSANLKQKVWAWIKSSKDRPALITTVFKLCACVCMKLWTWREKGEMCIYRDHVMYCISEDSEQFCTSLSISHLFAESHRARWKLKAMAKEPSFCEIHFSHGRVQHCTFIRRGMNLELKNLKSYGHYGIMHNCTRP